MRASGAAALLALTLAAGACGGAGGKGAGRYDAVIEALCEAEAAGEAGDATAAEAAFEDRAHDGLHALAAEVQERDRAAAARLLEAKQAVESALRGGGPAPDLGALLGDLEEAARAALGALEMEVVGCEA